jgi:hypothetical protein
MRDVRRHETAAMTSYGPPEHVYVENEWYDGPRAGVADINGSPSRFKSLFDEKDDDYTGTFLIWPIDKLTLDLEIEQWNIFVAWNSLYESGRAVLQCHPGHGGVDARWDDLQVLLERSRAEVPPDARRAIAQVDDIERDGRYESTGPAYRMCWKFL